MLKDDLAIAVAASGCAIILWRLGIVRNKRPLSVPHSRYITQSIEIIVPARNEAQVIALLLESLCQLNDPNFEIIVVNDQSSDATGAIADKFPVKLVNVETKPDGWVGKSWACHLGAFQATGDLLLFTDADTTHNADSLTYARAAMQANDWGMCSTLPYHMCPARWETLLGPFHLLLLLVTAPWQKASRVRLFAIGQYLMFRRHAYEQMGGHESVRGEPAEDLALAKRCLVLGFAYGVIADRCLYKVRMYASFASFWQGWRRNFLLGMRQSHWKQSIEVVVVVAALISLYIQPLRWPVIALGALSLAAFAYRQRQLGDFSILGVLCLPLSLSLFMLISFAAVADRLLRRSVVWKGRVINLRTGL